MARRKTNLSKSTVIRGLQCPKSLYLYKYHYKSRDPLPPERLALFQRGHDIGKLAHDLFPGGQDMTPKAPWFYKQAVAATKQLVDQQFPVIYEAAFQFQEVVVYLDMLVFDQGHWRGYEVKSSRSISETYLNDTAIQYYVITGAGLDLEEMSIVHPKPDFDETIHKSAQEVFAIDSVMGEVCSRQAFVADAIEQAAHTVRLEQVPDVPMGDQCDSPYECDFKGVCSGARRLSE